MVPVIFLGYICVGSIVSLLAYNSFIHDDRWDVVYDIVLWPWLLWYWIRS